MTNLSPQIETGEYVPEPIQLNDEPHSGEEVSAFVNGVVDAISTDLWVSLSNCNRTDNRPGHDRRYLRRVGPGYGPGERERFRCDFLGGICIFGS